MAQAIGAKTDKFRGCSSSQIRISCRSNFLVKFEFRGRSSSLFP